MVLFLLSRSKMPDGGQNLTQKEVLFLQLVSMFQVAAMQQLGKLVNPVSNEAERDLDQAKFSIDTLDVLKEKTAGNLSKAESDYLEKVLFELHMNYVNELETSKNSQTEETEDGQGSEGEQAADANDNSEENAEDTKGK